jgi:hypothetical protein
VKGMSHEKLIQMACDVAAWSGPTKLREDELVSWFRDKGIPQPCNRVGE